MIARASVGPKPIHALTVEQAAEQLQVSTKTVRRLIERGELPIHRIGRLLRVSQEAISAFYWQRLEAGTPCPTKLL
jgi:excisionase family DNA binding protein